LADFRIEGPKSGKPDFGERRPGSIREAIIQKSAAFAADFRT
jgi:hypothetical protein